MINTKHPKNFALTSTILIMLCMFAFTNPVNAAGYEEALIKDSLKITYKWRKYKRLKKNSPEVLMLKLENLRDKKVTVSFRVLFYWEGTLHSSSVIQNYCIKPGQKIKGKKWELAFYSPEFTEEKYSNPFFSWYVDELRVEENPNCKPGLKLKLVPSYPDKPDATIEPINQK